METRNSNWLKLLTKYKLPKASAQKINYTLTKAKLNVRDLSSLTEEKLMEIGCSSDVIKQLLQLQTDEALNNNSKARKAKKESKPKQSSEKGELPKLVVEETNKEEDVSPKKRKPNSKMSLRKTSAEVPKRSPKKKKSEGSKFEIAEAKETLEKEKLPKTMKETGKEDVSPKKQARNSSKISPRKTGAVTPKRSPKKKKSEVESNDEVAEKGAPRSSTDLFDKLLDDLDDLNEMQKIDLIESYEDVSKIDDSDEINNNVQVEAKDEEESDENDDENSVQFSDQEPNRLGETEIEEVFTAEESQEIEESLKDVQSVSSLTGRQLRWIIKEKCLNDLQSIKNEKRRSFYHENFNSPTAKFQHGSHIKHSMFSAYQLYYICGCLKKLFCDNKRIQDFSYVLNVLSPETLIRIVMHIRNVSYEEAENLMEEHRKSIKIPRNTFL